MTDQDTEERPKTARAQKGPSWLIERLPTLTSRSHRSED